MRQILISVEPYEKRVAIIRKGQLEEFHIERTDLPRLAGNIYKGVIESIVPGIGAAFVDIGTGKNGFLYIMDMEKKAPKMFLEEDVVLLGDRPPLNSSQGTAPSAASAKSPFERFKKGQELLVQVVKEPIGTKGALITTDISLPGKYLVLMPFDDTIGISKRIEDRQERSKLKTTLEEAGLPPGMGCIARTQSAKATARQLKLEIRYLLNLWSRIRFRAEKSKAPSLAYEEYDLPLRVIRDYFDEDVEKILVDSKDEYRTISRFASSMQPRLRRKIFYYRGRTPLYEGYGVEERVEELFRRKVLLKCGGSILIEKTESLVAIDVNTGKFTGKRNPEETTFKTNMEAAVEIARQIMLRDLGGIIAIDFIDMNEKAHRRQVCEALENAFTRDKAKINILPISQIGLLEMTRQRIRKSPESVSFHECPYCNGMGRVKTPATIAIEAVRRLKRLLGEKKQREVTLILHPDVAGLIGTSFKDVLYALQRNFRKVITVKGDARLHVEDIHLE
ncbi:MAG: hypothetical protein A2Z72_00565 [Omnitrophica bacterium RBG_13_46_9]|nr:MAG: hypothetical protein A2Z72_00565 [Omnitrophica bacterium RBG_13_46_9]